MKTAFDIILNLLLVFLGMLVIIWSLQLIFGGSPGLEEFNFALILAMAGFVIKLYRETGEIKVTLKHSFSKIREDIDVVKEDINFIRNKLK